MIQFIYDSDKELFRNAMTFAQKQVKRLIENYPDFYPMYTVAGKWKHEGPAWTHWCDGFLPGMMWTFAKHLGAAARVQILVRTRDPLQQAVGASQERQ